MVTALGMILCIAAIAGAFRVAEGEYSRMRRVRQLNRALAYAVGSSVTVAPKLAA